MIKRAISLFDYSGHIRDEFRSYNIECYSLDIEQHPGHKSTDFVCNFLDFDIQQHPPGHFDFCFCAMPCTAFSIASGGAHFRQSVPLSEKAFDAIRLLRKFHDFVNYHGLKFVIENPAGGLCNNNWFNAYFDTQITRLTFSSFGYPTMKKTDLFYNFPLLLIVPYQYRVNGKYQVKKLDNMSYRDRVTYPDHFVKWIVDNIVNQAYL